ncbi:MAG TPA: polyribonucleotide nucleotidyltransferase [Lutibacter sp.]|nr:polyribonucleotide nucleotidyltransferase [Lutibacter sp.]
MIPELFKEIITLNDGREISIETGRLAKQADGSVVVRMGDAVMLATVVSARKAKEGLNFLPLTVDYREKFAAAGRFPGGFFKREARPSDEEVLTMRLVDRVLRPLFPKDYHAGTQVMMQLMSHDPEVMPDALAGLAASAAIQLTDIPFEYPISEVRVARVDGNFVINPSREVLGKADIDLMVGASEESVMMVEGEMDEVSEEEMTEAIKFAHEAIKVQCIAQRKLAEKANRVLETREYEMADTNEDIEKKVHEFAYQKIYDIAKAGSAKQERTQKFSDLREELCKTFSEEDAEEFGELIKKYYSKTQKKAIRDVVLNEGIRLDGRATDEIRDIWCEIAPLPSTHGSSIFTRGETQALATVTLGTSRDVNMIDLPTHEGEERFYLHYNFPPFSTGEERPLRGTSRREVGHGHLAQRALKGMIPDNTPYTIRIVSEILESNGSSSMATVCAGTMALMDAGVQMIKPVSGIAMGLITDEETGKYAVLSDILGDEDHLGDMDFKVTGTADGITACQMDIKVKGLSYDIMEKALSQAKDGRLHILKELTDAIAAPNETVKSYAPKMVKVTIPGKFIGAVIGPGGKVIQEMQKETGCTIVIDEDENDNGIVEILGVNQEKIDDVIQKIEDITFSPNVNEVYKVKVIKILDFGAVVEFRPGKEVLLHISELAWARTENVSDIVSIGEEIEVKYLGTDPRTRKQKVSLKALTERPPRKEGDRDNRDNRDRKPRQNRDRRD